MKIIEVNITRNKKPRQILQTLKKKHLQRGDTLRIKTKDEESIAAAVLLLLVLVIWYFNANSKRKKSFGEEVEAKLFNRKISPEDFEKQIMKEYNITVEVETEKKEYDQFLQLSVSGLSKAYDLDEEDYSNVLLREPNPGYGK